MRLGFFAGIDGDKTVFEGLLELLADCDRLISLGNLLGEPAATDADLLRRASELVAAGRLTILADAGERARDRDSTLPPELRALLREASPASVVEGVVVLGGAGNAAPAARRSRQEAENGPHLVAPITVASGETTRSWRAAAGSLSRIEPLAGSLPLPREERVRIDVGPTADNDGVLGAAVIDLATRTAEVRERLWFRARVPAAERRATA